MSVADFFKNPTQIIRMIVTVLFGTGSMITTYYLFAFKVDKYGFYYKDADQYWLAIGVGILVLGWFVRNWNKI